MSSSSPRSFKQELTLVFFRPPRLFSFPSSPFIPYYHTARSAVGTYCMPEDGVELQPVQNMLSDAEVLKIATLFVNEGVNKIRVTGGEPTVRKGIMELMGE